MGEQVAAGAKKIRLRPFDIERTSGEVNLHQQGSAVEIELVLPVIRGSKVLDF